MIKPACIVLALFAALTNLSNTAAQSVSINTDGSSADASALLDVKSTTKGILIPRLTSAQRTAISSPATGLIVYDTDLNQFHYYNGTSWTAVPAGNTNYWTALSGNIYNNTGTNVGIGTTSPGDKLEVNGNLRFTGIDTIYAAPSATGSGKSVWLRAGSAYVPVGGSGGSINLEATNNMPSGGSGYGNLGPSGVINITAGSGYNTAGGNINITAGQSSYWALINDSHSDVIVKGGFNINAADAGTFSVEGGRIISFNSTTSNGGNLVLKPGIGAGGGTNGYIQFDGIIALTVSANIAGGTSGSPVSLLNQKSYIGVLPASGTNNYYQLPSPVTYTGRIYYIRNNSASFTAIITTAAGQLYPGNSNTGSSSFTLNPTSSPKTVMAVSDGQNWIIITQN